MKILIAGDWHSELHEEAAYQAFLQLGHESLRFAWYKYFEALSDGGKLASLLLRAQNKYMFGPAVNKLNKDFVCKAEKEQPDLIFVYRGSHIYPETLRRIRLVAPDAILLGYNNDDPFSPYYPKWKWRHFLAGVPEYDLVLAYRLHNLEEYEAAGAKRVELLRSWFIPGRNYPVELSDYEREQFECDVVFVGHYEEDGRLEFLEEIVRRGWKLRVFGHDYGWHSAIKQSKYLKHLLPLKTVWGDEYNKALVGAKVALCFFSKLNRDTYTRRCFEIPASGTVLMSEFSNDLAGLFEMNKEAVFFDDIQGFLGKLELLLNKDQERKKIATSGTLRVWKDGHDIISRMSNVLGWVNDIKRGPK